MEQNNDYHCEKKWSKTTIIIVKKIEKTTIIIVKKIEKNNDYHCEKNRENNDYHCEKMEQNNDYHCEKKWNKTTIIIVKKMEQNNTYNITLCKKWIWLHLFQRWKRWIKGDTYTVHPHIHLSLISAFQVRLTGALHRPTRKKTRWCHIR